MKLLEILHWPQDTLIKHHNMSEYCTFCKSYLTNLQYYLRYIFTEGNRENFEHIYLSQKETIPATLKYCNIMKYGLFITQILLFVKFNQFWKAPEFSQNLEVLEDFRHYFILAYNCNGVYKNGI